MKNALILHGTNGAASHNWFPWLQNELELKGYKVWVPNLPGANKPNIQRYNKFIFSSGWEFNNESILIGHSSGAMAALGIIQELPPQVVVDTVILVGAFKDNLGQDYLDEVFLKPFEYENIRNRAKRIILIHSDNDPYCPLSHAEFLAKELNAELVVESGQAHFSISTAGEKYKEFPLLLELLS